MLRILKWVRPTHFVLPHAVRPDHRKYLEMGPANDATNLEMGLANDATRLRTASVRQDARRARTPTKPQMNTITSGGILSGSSREGSPPRLTAQLPLFL